MPAPKGGASSLQIRICFSSSVNFLHLRGLICSALNLLKWGQIIIVTKALVIIVNAEAELDHAVNATSELCGLVKVEARCEERGVEEEPDEVLDSLVRLVSRRLL